MNSTPRIHEGDLIADRFKILSSLGEGGFGAVYRAEQLSTGREVALKILNPSQANDPETLERFHREARQTCQLNHPNTITCFDFGEDTRRRLLFIAMEYLPGESLSARLKREGALSPMATLSLLEQIAGSLHEAHQRGMVHRDVKPANIMLVDRGLNPSVAKVIDFGIAKIVDSGDTPPLTAANTVLGTPHYMSPEQIRGHELDARADVYALGVLVFEMLTGRRPFNGARNIDVLKAHIFDPIPPLSCAGVPASAHAIIARALAKDRDQRWTSTVEFAVAFRAALDGRATARDHNATIVVSAVPPASPPRLAPAPTRSPRRQAARAPRETSAAAPLPRWFWVALTTTVFVVAILVAILVSVGQPST